MGRVGFKELRDAKCEWPYEMAGPAVGERMKWIRHFHASKSEYKLFVLEYEREMH